jgi:cellulose synthase/poly-beta-1,6-N-acetylglucosamine synthase-like glycosyltransferase
MLVLATLPLLVELLVLTVAALLPTATSSAQRAEAESDSFRLAVLVPAHNEEALIGRCVQSVLNSADADTELLVVAHNCTDATAAVAQAAGARVLLLNDPDQTGKGCALHSGFVATLGGPAQAVLVIDADSVLGTGLIAEVRRRFLMGAQALQCRYEVNNPRANRRTRLMALALQAFNVVRPLGRERLGLSVGILGNGFALRREVLERIPYGAHSVVEDLEYHLTLLRAGIRVEFVHTATVRGEMPLSNQGARTQRARWEGGRKRMIRRWVPTLMVDLFRGRVRALEPLLDLMAAPIATQVLLLLVAICLPVPWLRFYVLGAFSVLIFHVVVAASCGLGFWSTMRVVVTAPGYILWKLWIIPETWRTASANSAWVRTHRDFPADGL